MKVTPEDALFSRYVRLLAEGKCSFCGQEKSLDKLVCSHFHGRRKLSTRHDEDNCVGICGGCHTFFHDNPNSHSEFFRERLGSVRYEQLNIRANTILKRSLGDKKALRKELREKIAGLENGN